MKAISILLIFLIAVNITSISIINIAYQTNVNYFTQNFCVNKSKPILKCNGKCHLNKIIKKNTSSNSSKLFSIEISSIYILQFVDFNISKNVLFIPKTQIRFISSILKSFILVSEKPPQLF